MEEEMELLKLLDEKIDNGRKLIEQLKSIEHKVKGADKLGRKINQEIKFLNKVRSAGNVKKEYLQSTNLIHLNAMVERLLSSKEPTSVMKPFKIDNTRLEVDIVCNSGDSWVKVIARNARALTLISLGNGEYGQKSVLDQAKFYLNCAKLHPHRYKLPEVIFHFACGIEIPLAMKLEKLGILVEGERINADDIYSSEETNIEEKIYDNDESDSESIYSDTNDVEKINFSLEMLNSNVKSSEIKVLNLDVSTLLAYVSNMTNGHANFVYLEPLLTLQAEWERSRPLKPILEKLFEGKELLICRTAYCNFMDIIQMIGGPNETLRANELVERATIVDDAVNGRILELSLGGKIKPRSRLVFATGEFTKSITVSANEGFVNAARMQGIECTVVLHEPRSLSEMKEKYAKYDDSS
ncbi:hypothetical protein PV327_009081 [Microctonus hyperodae]|uniref:DUF1308 domain-containing protein n=1 Tax=Microctonus hyperodae TaxID=165561 RepID=A0AA39FU35_MICHY|nr:hypothetical protein PV327_009081 [Microctonus hyperodae]